MRLSMMLSKFPVNGSLVKEAHPDQHDSAPASTMKRPIKQTAGLTSENAVDVTPALSLEGKPQQTHSESKHLCTSTSTTYFEHIFFGETDWESEGSECSETMVNDPNDLEVIVGPSQHAAKPHDLRQLKIWSVRTQSWEPIRSTPSTLYFTDIINLSQAQAPSRTLSFGSILHMNGSPQCRPCTFERPRRQCKKRWLCDSCHMHISAEYFNLSSKGAGSLHTTHTKLRW